VVAHNTYQANPYKVVTAGSVFGLVIFRQKEDLISEIFKQTIKLLNK
jgi:hypothetical protein